MIYTIKGTGDIEINTIVLDLNGTLSVYGQISEVTENRIKELKNLGHEIIVLSGDQRSTATELSNKLGIEFIKCKSLKEKEAAMKRFNLDTTASIGNARIDIGTFKGAKIRIATLQAEGIHTGILPYVDIIVPSIEDALQLFIDNNSFSSTMRI